jgi:outer membrane protein assembly factor BamA
VKIAAVLCLGTMLGAAAQQQFPLESMSADGVAIPAAILQNLTGLKPGDSVDDAAFQAAARKLQETGLFSEIDFHYTPGPKKIGYALILSLKEHPQRMQAIFDFPGKSEEQIWACIKQQYPWLSNPLPADGAAQEFIARATERCLGGATPVIAQLESDIATHKSQLVFRPRDMPHVTDISFLGTQKLSAKQVQDALSVVAMNSEFSERRFRSLLELNIRPLYEAHGLLNVQFRSITFTPAKGGVAVATGLDEGLVYKLGEVTIDGPDLPADVAQGQSKFKRGQIAAWPEIMKSIEDLEKPLRTNGYLAVRSQVSRALDDSAATLTLKVSVAMGAQSFFNALSFDGAPQGLEPRLRRMWNLASGAPMDQPYMIEYWKSILQVPELKPLKVSVSMKPLGGNKVDVVVAIK